MLGITWLKYRLSHISRESWHYQLTQGLWGYKAEGKACSYYWYKLPLAVLVWMLMMLVLGVITVLSFFFGYVPTFIESKEPDSWQWTNDACYDYRTLPNGKKIPRFLVPWQIAVVGGVLFGLYYVVVVNQLIGIVLLASVLGVLAVAAIVFAISRNWNSPPIKRARQAVVDAWNKACPDLVPEDRQRQEEDPQVI